MPQFTFTRDLPVSYNLQQLPDVVMTTATATTTTSNGGSSPKDNASTKSSSSRRKYSISIPTKNINGNKKPPTHAEKSSDDNFSDVRTNRRRTLSNSSGDHEMVSENMAEHDSENANPRKRGSTDTIDYPRRRATIAVSSPLPMQLITS